MNDSMWSAGEAVEKLTALRCPLSLSLPLELVEEAIGFFPESFQPSVVSTESIYSISSKGF